MKYCAHIRKTIFWGHISDLSASLSFNCKLWETQDYRVPGKNSSLRGTPGFLGRWLGVGEWHLGESQDQSVVWLSHHQLPRTYMRTRGGRECVTEFYEMYVR